MVTVLGAIKLLTIKRAWRLYKSHDKITARPQQDHSKITARGPVMTGHSKRSSKYERRESVMGCAWFNILSVKAVCQPILCQCLPGMHQHVLLVPICDEHVLHTFLRSIYTFALMSSAIGTEGFQF